MTTAATNAEIGAYLRTARQAEDGLTLPKLGLELGVSYGLIAQIERGEQTPDIGVLWFLCLRLEAMTRTDFLAMAAKLDGEARLKIDLGRLPDEIRGALVAVLAREL